MNNKLKAKWKNLPLGFKIIFIIEFIDVLNLDLMRFLFFILLIYVLWEGEKIGKFGRFYMIILYLNKILIAIVGLIITLYKYKFHLSPIMSSEKELSYFIFFIYAAILYSIFLIITIKNKDYFVPKT